MSRFEPGRGCQRSATKQPSKRSWGKHTHTEAWKTKKKEKKKEKNHGIKEEGEGASSHRCFFPLKRGFLPFRKKIINTFTVAMPTRGFSLHT